MDSRHIIGIGLVFSHFYNLGFEDGRERGKRRSNAELLDEVERVGPDVFMTANGDARVERRGRPLGVRDKVKRKPGSGRRTGAPVTVTGVVAALDKAAAICGSYKNLARKTGISESNFYRAKRTGKVSGDMAEAIAKATNRRVSKAVLCPEEFGRVAVARRGWNSRRRSARIAPEIPPTTEPPPPPPAAPVEPTPTHEVET